MSAIFNGNLLQARASVLNFIKVALRMRCLIFPNQQTLNAFRDHEEITTSWTALKVFTWAAHLCRTWNLSFLFSFCCFDFTYLLSFSFAFITTNFIQVVHCFDYHQTDIINKSCFNSNFIDLLRYLSSGFLSKRFMLVYLFFGGDLLTKVFRYKDSEIWLVNK